MNHPVTLQTLVEERLNSLRSEGMRSQELRRAGILDDKQARRSLQSREVIAHRDTRAVKNGVAGLVEILFSLFKAI